MEKALSIRRIQKKQGLSDQECLEQTLQAFSKYDVKKAITVYRDYNYFKDFQKQAKQIGVEVLGCQWISLAEDLPEVLDYEKDKTILGVKVHNKRNYTIPERLVSASDFLAGDISPLINTIYNYKYLKENTEKYWDFLKKK